MQALAGVCGQNRAARRGSGRAETNGQTHTLAGQSGWSAD